MYLMYPPLSMAYKRVCQHHCLCSAAEEAGRGTYLWGSAGPVTAVGGGGGGGDLPLRQRRPGDRGEQQRHYQCRDHPALTPGHSAPPALTDILPAAVGDRTGPERTVRAPPPPHRHIAPPVTWHFTRRRHGMSCLRSGRRYLRGAAGPAHYCLLATILQSYALSVNVGKYLLDM